MNPTSPATPTSSGVSETRQRILSSTGGQLTARSSSFAQDELPIRIGDFRPESHPLFQVRDGGAWSHFEWGRAQERLYECYVEPLVVWANSLTQENPAPPDPTLHLRLLEVEDELAREEARSRLVSITYVENLWPGHRGTYVAAVPGSDELVMEVGDTKQVRAETAAKMKADFGDHFEVLDPDLPSVPSDRGQPFLSEEAFARLRRERERLRLVLGMPG